MNNQSVPDEWLNLTLTQTIQLPSEPEQNIQLPSEPIPIFKTPIICVLGQVDSGKTSLLDALRNTNIVEKEAGRITQRIQGTNIQKEEIQYYFSKFKTKKEFQITIPGILLLDTPGHESFVSLRELGTNLCNLAIIIVDIRKGPAKQTIEAVHLLIESNTPFIIALNKIDTIYGWKSVVEAPFSISIKNQKENTVDQFNKLIKQNFLQFAEQGINAKLYLEVPNFKDWTPMVPISAKTKEGFSDLIAVIVKMSEKLLGVVKDSSITKGIVLEKYLDVQGIGTCLDIIVTNGSLNINDTIYIQGQPSKIKTITAYNHGSRKTETLKQVTAAFCCQISGSDGLYNALPGHTFTSDKSLSEQVQVLTKEEIDKQVLTNEKGIFIQADSVGSLLALSYVLKQNNVPIGKYLIGNTIRQKTIAYVFQFCEPQVILGFNVVLENGAGSSGVKVFTDKIVFKLVDKYTEFFEEYQEEKKRELLEKRNGAVFPCILSIEKDGVFRQKAPLIFAVKVKKGFLRIGTPLSVFKMEMQKTKAADTYVTREVRTEVVLGKVMSIRDTSDKDIEVCQKGQVAVIKVEGDDNITFGRHFDMSSIIYSRITRASLDCLKENFKEDINKDCLDLLVKLKKVFDI